MPKIHGEFKKLFLLLCVEKHVLKDGLLLKNLIHYKIIRARNKCEGFTKSYPNIWKQNLNQYNWYLYNIYNIYKKKKLKQYTVFKLSLPSFI